MECEQINPTYNWICGNFMTSGARPPPIYPFRYDCTTVSNQPLCPWLDDLGQATENTNFSTVTFPLAIADIPPSHSPMADLGGIATPLASVHSTNRNANADNSRHQFSKGVHHPYHNSITLVNRRKARQPAATFEPNIITLQDRLRKEGGDHDAVKLAERVFSNGVTLGALTRRQTREEAAQQVFGQGGGPVYLAFLETLPLDVRENPALWTRFRCRLCPNNVDAISWRHHRDVLRHLKRDHFGLGEMCFQWYVFWPAYYLFRSLTVGVSGKQVYTKGEMSSHRCKVSPQ